MIDFLLEIYWEFCLGLSETGGRLLVFYDFDGCLEKADNLLLAERYWKNLSNQKNESPIMEILVDGDIEVVEIAKEVNANL